MGREIFQWFEAIISFLPGRIGCKIRSLFYQFQFKGSFKLVIGKGSEFFAKENIRFNGRIYFNKNAILAAENGGFISVDDNSRFSSNVTINASDGGKIIIGKDCLFGPNVVLRTGNHNYDQTEVSIVNQGYRSGNIIVGDDVWIGTNAVILAGVKIGNGAIIGAGSVVTNNIPSMAIAVGVPCKVIKYRGQSWIFNRILRC